MVQKAAASKRTAAKKLKGRSEETVDNHSSSSSNAPAAFTGHPRKRYMGVRQSPSGRWVAEIKATAQKIRMWLGTFDTAEAAARAYDEAACLLRGPNTRTNFWSRSGGSGLTSSVLSAKVLNHLLGHLEMQRATESFSSSGSPQPPSSLSLPSLPPPPAESQLLAQLNDELEIEPITRIAYSEFLSEVSISGSSQSGEENEFSPSYYNIGARLHKEMSGYEEEVDMDLRALKNELSGYYAPFEMNRTMEEERTKTEMGTYEYWLMLSTAGNIL